MRKKKVENFFKAARLPTVTNSRGSQKLIPVPVSSQLEADIIKAMRAGGYTNRSDFIRDAIREKAATVGVVIPAQLARGPMRVEYPEPRGASVLLNDRDASSVSGGKTGGSLAEVEAQAEALAHQHSLAAPSPILKRPRPSGGKRRRASGGQPGKGAQP